LHVVDPTMNLQEKNMNLHTTSYIKFKNSIFDSHNTLVYTL
jgi:hypothetical protein